MATVVDSLVVLLNLDPSGFSKGQKEAVASLKKTEESASKTAKNMQADGKKAAEFFSGIRNQVLALGAAFLGVDAIKSFAEQITQSDAALGRLANNVGVSTEALSAWEGAAERAGGSKGGIDSTFKAMADQVQRINNEGTPGAEVLEKLARAGINVSKYFDKSTDSTERLLMAADAFKGMDPGKAQFLGKGLGYDEGTINLLMKGRTEVSALLEKQKALNAVSQADADAAIARNKAWKDLTDTFEGGLRPALTAITPVLTELLGEFGKWILDNKKWIETGIVGAVKDFADWIKSVDWHAVGEGIRSFAKGANDAAEAVGGWKVVLEGLFALWAGAKFAAMLTGIAQMGGALSLALGPAVIAAAGIAASIKAISYMREHEDEQREKFDKTAIGAFQSSGLMPMPAGRTAAQQAYIDKADERKAAAEKTGWKPPDYDHPSSNVAGSDLGSLISRGEGGYSSVNRGKSGGYKSGTENLEGMTVAEVMRAQKAGAFNAAGRYQVISGTLAEAVKSLGIKGDEKFDKSTQDRIFNDYLVKVKRKDAGDYISGKSDNLDAAAKAMAKEWASVADPMTGQSFYAGTGNNKASISADEMKTALQNARANQASSNSNTSASTSETHIGTIQVNTKATDAKGIAGDIGSAIQQNSKVTQAGSGVV